MSRPESCPVHAPAVDRLNGWPCPEDCEYLLIELHERFNDTVVHGNYWVLLPKDLRGRRFKQRYQNHEPVGDPQLKWDSTKENP
jgi:hypothetical protein